MNHQGETGCLGKGRNGSGKGGETSPQANEKTDVFEFPKQLELWLDGSPSQKPTALDEVQRRSGWRQDKPRECWGQGKALFPKLSMETTESLDFKDHRGHG